MAVWNVSPFKFNIIGNDNLLSPWREITGPGERINNHWNIAALPNYQVQQVAFVDMGLHNVEAHAINEDRLTLAENGSFVLNIRGVEHIDAPADKTVDLEVVGKTGFTTDGSLNTIETNVGNHVIFYTGATRDSTLFTGTGWDQVRLIDHPGEANTQYWSLVRRADGQIDAYSLYSGYQVRMEDGGTTWGNTNGRLNYGEVDEIYAASRNRPNGDVFQPGNDLSDTGDRGNFDNIDLSDAALANFTDRFIAASFKSINYATQNVHVGTAIVETFNGDTTGGTQSASRDHITTNGDKHLLVNEETVAIDGHLRLYVRDNNSGLYNRFNEVYLGTAADEVNANNYSTTSKNAYATNQGTGQGTTLVLGTAMYGFGGNDVLTGGTDVDYLFGGESTYSQLNFGDEYGNRVTGGDGADYFGVGNISTGLDGDAIMTSGIYTTRLSGTGTDVILDWTYGEDFLRVLGNGTAIIDGLGTINDPNVASYSFQQIGASSEMIRLDSSNVVNEGKIVVRGLGGDDTIYGSTGSDYIYGGDGTNEIFLNTDIAEDRAYVDQFVGRQVVGNFNNSNDKVYLNVDAIFNAHDRVDNPPSTFNIHGSTTPRNPYQLDWVKDSSTMSFINGQGSAFSLDLGAVDIIYFPWSETYLGQLNIGGGLYSKSNGAWRNTSHESADDIADIALGIAGGALVLLGTPMLFNPFTFAIGISLIATGGSQIAAVITSEPHLNAEYRLPYHLGDYYANYLTAQKTVNTTVGTPDSPLFTSFFWDNNVSTSFAKAVEFIDTTGNDFSGITTYAILRSDTETFVYFIQSADHIVTDDEARIVAEIEGAVDLANIIGYQGSLDVYNQVGVVSPVFPQTPTIVATVSGTTTTSGRMKDDSIDLSITLAAAPTLGDSIEIYNGSTLLTTINTSVSVTSYTFTHMFMPPAAGSETFLKYLAVSKSSQGFSSSSDTLSLIYDNKPPEILDVIASSTGTNTGSLNVIATGSGVSASEPFSVYLVDNTQLLVGSSVNITASSTSAVLSVAAQQISGLFDLRVSDALNNYSSFEINGQSSVVYLGTSGNDTYTDSSSTGKIIFSFDGNDTISAGGGDDLIIGGAGEDVINGGGGNNTISYVGSAAVTVNLTTNNNTGGDAQGDLLTNIQNLIGSSNGDNLTGDANNNIITGGAGNDIITGGAGADMLTGGGGNDTFVFADGDGVAPTAFGSLTTSGSVGDIQIGTTITVSSDVITDFESTDLLTTDGVGNLVSIIGQNAALGGLGDNSTYIGYGSYAAGIFTVAAGFDLTTANDALLITDGANTTFASNMNIVIIGNLAAELGNLNFTNLYSPPL